VLSFFGLISGLLACISHIPYLIDILKGTTKPERASWLIWLVLGSISFFSQMAKGATDSLWLVGGDTLGTVLTFILAIKFGVGGLAKRDLVSLAFAFLGLVLWFFTKEPLTALIIVILVDFAGAILTVIKSYEDPGSETLATWVLCSIAGFFAVLSVGEFNLILLLYPLYLCFINGATAVVILVGKRKS